MKRRVKVVFLFTSNGAAAPGQIKSWKPDHPCDPHYVQHHSTEGYMKMLGTMYKMGHIDDLKIFYESNRGHGLAEFYPGVYGEVVPHIDFVNQHITEDTIIFARGGFKGWHNFLKARKGKNWLVVYAANTGREKWDWWDVVLHDLENVNKIDLAGRYWHYFLKPVDQDLFRRTEFNDRYDVCIGANHIHDKKGQWKTIQALATYQDMFGEKLRAVLPGGLRRGIETNNIPYLIKQHGLNVVMPGMVPREKMKEIYNSSRLFVHLTYHGQNDRGPLEAMSCGCHVVILTPSRHSPVVWKDKRTSTVIEHNHPVGIAQQLRHIMSTWQLGHRRSVEQYFRCESDFTDVILPRMTDIFYLMANNPPTMESKEKMCEYFTPGVGSCNC